MRRHGSLQGNINPCNLKPIPLLPRDHILVETSVWVRFYLPSKQTWSTQWKKRKHRTGIGGFRARVSELGLGFWSFSKETGLHGTCEKISICRVIDPLFLWVQWGQLSGGPTTHARLFKSNVQLGRD
jgi:hypothetical protein